MNEMVVNTARAIFSESRPNGLAVVFEMTPPMTGWDGVPMRYVRASAARVPYSGPEVYLFHCDSRGEVLDWSEQPGSRRGTLDIARVMQETGYRLVGEMKEIEA